MRFSRLSLTPLAFAVVAPSWAYDAPAKPTVTTPSSYYVERRSYGTGRESEPPRYVKQANRTWLKDHGLAHVDWLDIGLDYRLRYEYRDNDFRRGQDTLDQPLLLRTRSYLGVKQILDPLRFAVEIEDARRINSQFSDQFDTRDLNKFEPIQAYAELYWDDALGADDRGNPRSLSVKAGIHSFEYLDRRLFARNEWRNTTNTFQGLRSALGQRNNDWQVDLLALQPITRFTDRFDRAEEGQRLLGVIGDWRRWSRVATVQPFYIHFRQDGERVNFDANGRPLAANQRIDRDIHTLGVRAYGVQGRTGWDYDISYQTQWGDQERRNAAGAVTAIEDHQAYAYNIEFGYSWAHPWKPRLSASYGVATGDKNNTDGRNQRFERLFGFARPWSNNDYFQMENVNAPKIRIEFEPTASLKVDAGLSSYRLDSATDRWNAANNLRDTTGNSGKALGEELDVRLRFPVTRQIAANVGYAFFQGNDFTQTQTRLTDPDRRANSHFAYVELSVNAF